MTIDELCELAGDRATRHAPLGALTTYRVGGSARVLLRLSSMGDVEELWPAVCATGLTPLIIGNGSNVLINEGEHELIAICLDGALAELRWRDDTDGRVVVEAGAGVDLPVAARRLAADGVVGFEWAVGIPGTFGGAVVMNAGGHGGEMRDHVSAVQVAGQRAKSSSDLDFGYRHSNLGGQLVVGVELVLSRGDAALASERVSEIVAWRRAHQPGGRNAGSVFRNPEGDHAGRLIEAAGLKGYRIGTAEVSLKHANFIVVDDGGSASDIYALMCHVRDTVRATSGVTLEFENHLIGWKDEE